MKYYALNAVDLQSGSLRQQLDPTKGPTYYQLPLVDGHWLVRPNQRATAGQQVYVPAEARVAILRVGFNSRKPAFVEGPAVRWSYADGHGMDLLAVLAPGEFSLWAPGHHGHGAGRKFAGSVSDDLSLTLTEILPERSTIIPG